MNGDERSVKSVEYIFKGFRGLNRSTEFPSVCATCTQKRCKIQKVFKSIAKAGILEAELVVIKCENHELKRMDSVE
jgi:hypothetical protein